MAASPPARPYSLGTVRNVGPRVGSPPNALAEAKSGRDPERWAPGVGQGTASLSDFKVPLPDAPVPPTPYKNLKGAP